MRTSSTIKTMLVIVLTASLITSCEKLKDIGKRDFEVNTKTWYRVAPIAPVPVVVNGINYVGFSYFPGGGKGSATYLGECTIYFTQLAYGTSPEAPPIGSIAVPLTGVPSYPVLGGPLPLIQPGDFTELTQIISRFQIPAQIHDKIVNSVLYNSKNDAIFLSGVAGAGTIVLISPTVARFNGKSLIVGGRGKFRNATGEVDYSGYFSLVDANDAEFNAKGWICF